MPTSEPAYCRPAAFDFFREQLPELDSGTGLFRAAFAISLHERPEACLREVEDRVERLTDTVRSRVQSASSNALLAHLHDVLFDVFGMRGNTLDYYSPANSYLSDVLRTRLGIPITLVLVYKRVAEPLGLVVHGVNSPGHFLAEVEVHDRPAHSPFYVDPFFGGNLLKREEVVTRITQATGGKVVVKPDQISRASHVAWITRMLTNLQAAFSAAGQERNLYAMQELQALLPR